jgi:hypothetical protein
VPSERERQRGVGLVAQADVANACGSSTMHRSSSTDQTIVAASVAGAVLVRRLRPPRPRSPTSGPASTWSWRSVVVEDRRHRYVGHDDRGRRCCGVADASRKIGSKVLARQCRPRRQPHRVLDVGVGDSHVGDMFPI